MDLGLRGQSAVIFGAARGIGRAIAEAFAAEGCGVGLFDRDPDVASVGRAMDASAVHSHAGDITSLADVQEAARAFESALGPIDHLVVAAGVGSGKFGFPFWNLAPADWQPVLEVNLLGAVNAAHTFAPGLAERRSGTLLFLTSVAGQIGSQTDPLYSAAKAGVINFMQCAARDLAPFGVRVNALAPGMVRTALNEAVWQAGQSRLPEDQRQSYEQWAEEKIRRVSPLGRWQEPEEFGAMAVYLASRQARSITGQTLNIDGGQVMHA